MRDGVFATQSGMKSERFRRGKSLKGDLAAGLFDLSLGLLGVFLLRGGEDGGGRGVNQVLGFLEAQAGQVLDDLDDGDLLVTGGLEDDLDEARSAGLTEDEIWDIGAITALFAMSNRLAHLGAIDPNPEFFTLGRLPR